MYLSLSLHSSRLPLWWILYLFLVRLIRVKAKWKRSASQVSGETAVDSPVAPSKAVEEESREEVPEAKRTKAAASTELATKGAETQAEADSTHAPEGGSESQTPGKVSLEIDAEVAADVGASAVKQKAGPTKEPVVVEVDDTAGTIVATGAAAMAQSPVVEVLIQSPSVAEPAGPFVMARRMAPFGSTI